MPDVYGFTAKSVTVEQMLKFNAKPWGGKGRREKLCLFEFKHFKLSLTITVYGQKPPLANDLCRFDCSIDEKSARNVAVGFLFSFAIPELSTIMDLLDV